MWNLREPMTYKGWYGKYWEKNLDYWGGSNVTYRDCRLNYKKNKINSHYIGTGGSIVDVHIFNECSNLWKIPSDLPDTVSVYNIEDLWLSFICSNYNYKLHRTLLPEKKTLISDNNNAMLWNKLKEQKKKFFKYLIDKGGWDINLRMEN